MNRSLLLWIIALIVTLLAARWQRASGPTHTYSGTASVGGASFRYALERTHAYARAGGRRVESDHRVAVGGLPGDATGVVEWRPYGGREPWIAVPMRRAGGALVAELPRQPVAGKLWYRVKLTRGTESLLIPPERPLAIRFRDDVPVWVLVPHILFMFAAMLLSTRAGLEAFVPRPALAALTWWTLGTLVVGGFVLGPFVTHYAFGGWWTGFPLGHDLTDNKTLFALLGWVAAAIAVGRSRIARAWVACAALLLLLVFAIPHSWSGAEPPYAPGDRVSAPAR